jgi:phosphatidylglycerophosphatase A
MLSWAVLSHFLPAAWVFPTNILLACLVVAIGILSATRVARASQVKDPQFVVIDETAGQLITLIGAPLTWKSFLAGFILFRAFDIVKPPPVRQLERLPEGTGIVVDDVAAGLYGLVVMQILVHFGLFGR